MLLFLKIVNYFEFTLELVQNFVLQKKKNSIKIDLKKNFFKNCLFTFFSHVRQPNWPCNEIFISKRLKSRDN